MRVHDRKARLADAQSAVATENSIDIDFVEGSSPIEVEYVNLEGQRRTITLELLEWAGDEVVFCVRAAAGSARRLLLYHKRR